MIIDFWNGYILSSFLDSIDIVIRVLFDRMVSASIIVSVLYGIILILRYIFNQNMPYARYYLWAVFFVTFLFYRSPMLPMVILNPLYTMLYNSFGLLYNNLVHSILSIVWMTIAITKIFIFLKTRKRFAYSLEHSEEIKNCSTFNKAYAVAGVKEKIYLCTFANAKSPASFGFTKKFIILPQGYKDKYTETELYCLFLHELTHIKMKDTCKNFILEIISIIFWLNPFIDRAIQKYKDDCEIICDLTLLSKYFVTKEEYGKLLIKELYNKNKIQFLTGLNNGFNFMRDRLTAINKYSTPANTKKYKPIILVTLLLSLGIYIALSNIYTDVSLNNTLIIISYDDGTNERIELQSDNPNISLSADKATLNNDYLTDISLNSKNVEGVEIYVTDISVGLFAMYCRTNNYYMTDNSLQLDGNHRVIDLPSGYKDRNNVFHSIYSHLLRFL